MARLSIAASAALQANPPRGTWHAIPCPGAPAFSLVAIEHWDAPDADDAWEDQPGVTPLYPETMSAAAPAALVTAFAPWGALQGDTMRQLLRRVRQRWAKACP